ncbi:MAG: ATP-binding protein [Ktedonobacteraceae bacterium]
MQEALEHWKEGVGVLLYFTFLAVFTPKAEALGWGYKGILFCVLAGGLLIFLLYLVVKFTAEYIASRREEIESFREYMGIGTTNPERVALAAIGTLDDHSDDELDAMLANNPYASPEVFNDDKYTHLLPSVSTSAGNAPQSMNEADWDRDFFNDTEEESEVPGGKVTQIFGENPRRRLNLAENFQPDADDPLATGVFFVGIPGSGKTVALALFLEQYIKRYRLATVIFDMEGDLKSIVEDGLCPRGLIATPETLPSMALVVKHRMQVVIDLQQCRKPGEAFINYELAARLIAQTLKDLMNAQSAIAPADRLPCLVGLDETHIWAPQNPPSYLDPKTAKDVLDTLTVIATRGRKYGVVPFLACQRIPKVHKDIIAGCETRILGKADLDNDISRYREYVSKEVISDQGIRSLGKGRMIVCMNGKRLLVQFDNRKSEHTSHTPSVALALNNPVGTIPPELLASMSRPLEAVQPHPASIPVVPRHVEPHRELPTRTSAMERRGHTVGLPGELQEALDAYRPGMNYRDLGRALNYSDDEARILFRELRQRGLLHATGNDTAQELVRSEQSVPALQDPREPTNIMVLPVRTEQKPQPTLKDAIVCWNALVQARQNPSRNNLQQALIAKGFECRENWARKFYEDIKALEQKAAAGEEVGRRAGG